MQVKICCIRTLEEAQLAIRHGATAVGLVSAMPSGPGVIAEDTIAEIAGQLPRGIESFLLTSLRDTSEILRQHRRCATTAIQLVDRVSEDTLTTLRQALPGIALVQVVHVTGPEVTDEALGVAPLVDFLLLDSGNPRAAVRELGGTGRVHNWDISRTIVERSPVPVYLAGGLRPDNVAQAITIVKPFGVDVCSGVRTNGILQQNLLAAFFHAIFSTPSGEQPS